MKATAIAPSNIAFIKYWGKKDEELRLPLNASISMNLTGAYTTTTVEFSPLYKKDTVTLSDGVFSAEEKTRVVEFLDRVRERGGVRYCARIVTKNTFPQATGAAASASGFAALTVAAFAAVGTTLSEKELTIFARLGSGSSCRSIPDGFVLWEKGETSDESYAHSLFPHTYWDLRDVLVIVDTRKKKVSTSEGQKRITTSPFWKDRVRNVPPKIAQVIQALRERNLQHLGMVIEEDCLNMHHVMHTQNPPVVYWSKTTKKLMEEVINFRKGGLPVYFTIDAGPNVHLICEAKNEKDVVERTQNLPYVQEIIVNKPAAGAHIMSDHLF